MKYQRISRIYWIKISLPKNKINFLSDSFTSYKTMNLNATQQKTEYQMRLQFDSTHFRSSYRDRSIWSQFQGLCRSSLCFHRSPASSGKRQALSFKFRPLSVNIGRSDAQRSKSDSLRSYLNRGQPVVLRKAVIFHGICRITHITCILYMQFYRKGTNMVLTKKMFYNLTQDRLYYLQLCLE